MWTPGGTVTALEGTDFEQITTLLHDHKLEKVLLINEADELTGMITVKDIVKAQAYPMACKDAQGQRALVPVLAPVQTDTRIAALVDAGVNVKLVVDTAHGHSQGVLDRVAWIKGIIRIWMLSVAMWRPNLVRRPSLTRRMRKWVLAPDPFARRGLLPVWACHKSQRSLKRQRLLPLRVCR